MASWTAMARAARKGVLGGFCVALLAGCTLLVDWSTIHEDDEHAPEAGGAEAGGAEAGSGPFCASQPPTPAFCDSFDEGPLGQRWRVQKRGSGTLALDGESSASSPLALLAQCPTCSPNRDSAYLDTQIPGAPTTSLSLSFDLRLEARASGQVGAIASLGTSGDKGGASLRLLLLADGSAIAEDSFGPADGSPPRYHANALAASPALGEWTRVEMRVDLGRPAHATVKLGQRTVLDGAILEAPFDNDATRASGSGGSTGVQVGVLYATGTWALRVDNVVHYRP